MRRTDVLGLFDYSYWVTHRLLHAAGQLSPEDFTATATVGTRDLRATLVHELDVEWSWRLNVQGKPMDEWGPDDDLRPDDYPDVATLHEHWRRDEAEMRTWLATLSDDDLAAPATSAFTEDTRPLWQYLVHIVVHGAQQQAEAAALLTLAGQSPGDIGYGAYLQDNEAPPGEGP